MNTRKRIERLEAAVIRQGWGAMAARMDERLRDMPEPQLTALRQALEAYCRDGTETPGLIETLKELTR